MRRSVYPVTLPHITRKGQIDGRSYQRFDDLMGMNSLENERNTNDREFLKKIKDFVETTVILKKETAGLGIQVVGGADTYLRGIVIKCIDPNGSAAEDGRLKSGDQILEVNGVCLQEMPHDKAVSAIRVASSPVRLLVFREDPEQIFTSKEQNVSASYTDPLNVWEVREAPYDPKSLIKVGINKPISECLGLSILARKDGNGVFVTYVAEGSTADQEGTIKQGDRIMQVNNENLADATQEHAALVLKRCYGNVKLTIGRIPSLYNSIKTGNARIQSAFVNYGMERTPDRDRSPRRNRSGSHGLHDCSKRARSSDENENNFVIPKQRRSVTMLETSMYYHPASSKEPCINTETKPADSQTVHFSINEDSMNNKMLETYGKEDYV